MAIFFLFNNTILTLLWFIGYFINLFPYKTGLNYKKKYIAIFIKKKVENVLKMNFSQIKVIIFQ